MRIGRLGLLLVFALTGCQSASLAPFAGSGASPGTSAGLGPSARGAHLYVAVETSTQYQSVERFRLVKGIPQSTPDRVYEGYGELTAVGGDGTLYAFGSGGVIYAFPPGSDKPARSIEVGNPTHCGGSSSQETEIPALASDSQGYLFAAIYTYDGGLRAHRRSMGPADGSVPCNGVVVFAPGANGNPKPVQTISLGKRAIVTGIAVDSQDDLYVGESRNTVAEYANSVTAPHRTRVFRTVKPVDVTSVATDGAGNVFISYVSQSYKGGFIDRYAPTAKSKAPPSSEIRLTGSGLHFLRSIAAFRRVLYNVDGFDSVDLYHARQNGDQSPFYSLPASGVSSVSVGP